ncbi:hypothetical protein OCU04_005893 [Sclerotinia nivalis]|uniref:Uncharacterized protein n=1 Tax=Sclerotinia nivalis TaxID=352851 RepID=A0A9X0ALU8_9HELO|nr:hypothetical protein OCU04_005893 [Sclerotinia nivalis]
MVSTVLAHREQRITSTLGSMEYEEEEEEEEEEDEDEESEETLEKAKDDIVYICIVLW